MNLFFFLKVLLFYFTKLFTRATTLSSLVKISLSQDMLNKSGIKRRFENYVQYAGIEAQKVRENPDIKF